MSTETSDPTLVVVEDDLVEVQAVRRGMRRLGLRWDVLAFSDGAQALRQLQHAAAEGAAERYLVLLDLNLPRMNGTEFLSEVRRDHELSRTAVFVLTTSDAPEDVGATTRLGVSGYFVKSACGEDYVDALTAVVSAWNGRADES